MTRKKLHWKLAKFTLIFVALLAMALVFKLSENKILNSSYEFIRDMSLIYVTIIAAYMAHVFQKRSSFLQSLREEWREIVNTKAVLVEYLDMDHTHLHTSEQEYLKTYRRISQAIDYMRIVYRNVGETKNLIGYYPYEPLHDMRRALETVDPRTQQQITFQDRKQAKKKIIEAFYALRERFLDEFDLEEPSRPILEVASMRKKLPGANMKGRRLHAKGNKHKQKNASQPQPTSVGK